MYHNCNKAYPTLTYFVVPQLETASACAVDVEKRAQWLLARLFEARRMNHRTVAFQDILQHALLSRRLTGDVVLEL